MEFNCRATTQKVVLKSNIITKRAIRCVAGAEYILH